MELRDYQKPIVEKVKNLLNTKGVVLLAAEPRCGKTLMSLVSAYESGARNVVFITPKKAIPSIIADYRMMDCEKQMHLQVYNPEAMLAMRKRSEKAAAYYMETNYPTVSKKGVKYKRLYEEHRMGIFKTMFEQYDTIDMVIADECHRLGAFPKPSGSQKAIKELAAGKKVILLSGTPNPESNVMFYHEFDVSENSPWHQYSSFYKWAKGGYVDVKEKMVNGYRVSDYSDGFKSKIFADIDNLVITLTQSDAGFATKIDERQLSIDMSADTVAAIKQLKRDRIALFQGLEIVADTPADLLNKIHQLSGGTIKIDDNRFVLDRSKAEYLKDWIAGRHVSIFYVYKAERDLLIETFGSAITEDWPTFQKDESKIFIGQIRSVREGIKLDTAEFSIFYSTEYSYVSYAQGIQRIMSKERSKPAVVYFLTSNCGIERMILDSVHNKEDFTLQTYYRNK